MRSPDRSSANARVGITRNHRVGGNPWFAAVIAAAIPGRGPRPGIDRARRLYRDLWRTAARILAAGMCLRTGHRSPGAGGEPALVHRRRPWFDIRRTAPAPGDLLALLHAGRTGRVCA